jgi:uncharacterized repeat protein (TIGR02543 family)
MNYPSRKLRRAQLETKTSHFRSWKSGKKWLYGATALTLLAGAGAPLALSLQTSQLVHATTITGLTAQGTTVDAGSHTLPLANPTLTASGDATASGTNGGSLVPYTATTNTGYLSSNQVLNTSKAFTINTNFVTTFNTSKDWLGNQNYINNLSSAIGIILVPEGQSTTGSTDVNSGSLGISGLANSIFAGRDMYADSGIDNTYQTHYAATIRSTDGTGTLGTPNGGTSQTWTTPLATGTNPWVNSVAFGTVSDNNSPNAIGTDTVSLSWTPTSGNTGNLVMTINSTVITYTGITLQPQMQVGFVSGHGSSYYTGEAVSNISITGTSATAPVTVNYVDSTGKEIPGTTPDTVTADMNSTLGVNASGENRSDVYDFTAPSVTGYTATTGASTTVTSGTNTLNVVYTANTYPVTYNAGTPAGTNLPANGTATYGQSYTIGAAPTPPAGYTFTGYLGSDGNTYQPGQVISNWTSTSGLTLTAQYTPNAATIDVNFIDDTTIGNTTISSAALTGVTDESTASVATSYASLISSLEEKGYSVVSSDSLPTSFDDQSDSTAATQSVTVHLVHTYTSSTATSSATRTINYLDASNSAVLSSATLQSVVYTETAITDKVTSSVYYDVNGNGSVDASDTTNSASGWVVSGTSSFAAVTPPDESAKGYLAPNPTTVPSATPTGMADSETVNVLYAHSTVSSVATSSATRTIDYVDGSDTSKVLSSATQTVNFSETAIIDAVTSSVLGYDTNGDGTVDTSDAASGWVASGATSFAEVPSPTTLSDGKYVSPNPASITAETPTEPGSEMTSVAYSHATSTAASTATVSQTINYVKADGTTVAPSNSQAITFTETTVTDLVTGSVISDTWAPASSSYAEVDSPSLAGYTPDKTSVDASTVTPTDKDTTVTVTYTANPVSVMTSGATSMIVGSTYTPAATAVDSEGKTQTYSPTNTNWKVTYSEDPSTAKVGDTITVTYSYTDPTTGEVGTATQNVAVTDTYAQKLNTVTETVHYVDATDNDHTVPSDNVQYVTFDTITDAQGNTTIYYATGNVTVEPTLDANGMPENSSWTKVTSDGSGASFASVTSPTVTNMTPDQTSVAKKAVNATDGDTIVTVNYTHNTQAVTQTVTQTVRYVMSDGTTAPTDNVQTTTFTGTKDLVTGDTTWDTPTSVTFNDVTSPTETGYTPDQTSVTGATVTPTSSDVTTKVTYTKDTTTNPQTDYTVSYDANGGTGTMASQTTDSSGDVTLTANAFTRDGYTFAGWNTAADGSGTSYTDGQAVTGLAADTTLYAQWTKNTVPVPTYTVTFDSAGGTAVPSQSLDENSYVVKPSDPTRDGYTFAGWYGPDDTLYNFTTPVTGDLTLTAHWTQNPTPDTDIPVITCPPSTEVQNGAAFDPMTGVSATDKQDGDLTSKVTYTITDANGNSVSSIDTTQAGTYTVTYAVSDSAGNAAATVTQTVTVDAASESTSSSQSQSSSDSTSTGNSTSSSDSSSQSQSSSDSSSANNSSSPSDSSSQSSSDISSDTSLGDDATGSTSTTNALPTTSGNAASSGNKTLPNTGDSDSDALGLALGLSGLSILAASFEYLKRKERQE